MCFLLGFPNQVLDLPLEGRQTIIPGPETPIFMIQSDLKGFSNSSGTTSHASSAARDYLLGRFMNKPRPEVLQVPEHGPKNKKPHGHVT